MTKEDIIEQNPILVQLIGNHGVGAYKLIGKAMDEYAKQQAIAFSKYMFEIVHNSAPPFVHISDDQFYSKFMEHQNQHNEHKA